MEDIILFLNSFSPASSPSPEFSSSTDPSPSPILHFNPPHLPHFLHFKSLSDSIPILFFTAFLILLSQLSFSNGLWTKFVHAQVEKKASKLTNGGKVTIGKLHLNLRLGVFECRDIVVHTAKRDIFEWKSPLICRVGYVKVKFHVMSCCDIKYWLNYPVKDVYAVFVSDVQAFVETRQMVGDVHDLGEDGERLVYTVYNFNLLDEMLDMEYFERSLVEGGGRKKNQTNLSTPKKKGSPSRRDKYVEAPSSSFKFVSFNNNNDDDQINKNNENNNNANDFDSDSDSDSDSGSDSSHNIWGGDSSRSSPNSNLTGSNLADRRGKMKAFSQQSVRAEKKATNLVSNILMSFGKISQSPNATNFKAEGMKLMSQTKEIMEDQSLDDMKKIGEKLKKTVEKTQKKLQSLARFVKVKKDWKRKTPNPKDIYRIGSVIVHDLRVFTTDLITQEEVGEETTGGEKTRILRIKLQN